VVFRSWDKKLLFGILLPIAFSTHAIAGEIVSEKYRYPSENEVLYLEANTFLICETCPEPGSLIIKPTLPLVIKESGSQIISSIPAEVLARLNNPLKEIEIELQKKPLPLEEPIKPQKFTIYFAFDSGILTPYSIERLGKISKESKGGKSIALFGYTDNIGSDLYNSNLSTQRALAVERFFQSKGFQSTRVSGKGSCCPISEKQSLNRRVEIIIK
jgi:outer membrane protein OmpA-like peptidoglycan-associated protein